MTTRPAIQALSRPCFALINLSIPLKCIEKNTFLFIGVLNLGNSSMHSSILDRSRNYHSVAIGILQYAN